MTEDEAKQKWCPFYRVTTEAGVFNTNRDGCNGASTAAVCIGSACMAWRWKNQMAGHSLDHHIRHHGKDDGARKHAEFMRANPLYGYCGLVGIGNHR